MTHDPRHGLLLRRLGRVVAGHPRAVVGLWLAFIVAGFTLSLGLAGTPSLFSRLHSGEILVPGENSKGRDLLARGGSTGFSTYVLTVEGVDLASPTVAAAAARAAREVSAVPRVASAVNPFVVPGGPGGPAAAPMLGRGGVASGDFAMVVTYDRSSTKEQEAAAQRDVDAALDRLVAAVHPERSDRGGIRTLVDAVVEQVRKDGQRGEGIALPVSFAVMVVVFGGLVAAGLPVLGAIASIAGALASLLGFSYLLDLDASVVNVVTVLGLGLCIDYGLLVVSRFREELRLGLAGAGGSSGTADAAVRRGDAWRAHVAQAAVATVDRAGRTVVFSALTVAISLCGLFVFDVEFVRAVAAAGVSVVLVALAAAVTLIPALCVLGARRILGRGTETSGDEGVFARLAVLVQRLPWPVVVGTLAVLLVAAAPVLGIRLTSSGAELLPVGAPERAFFENQRAVFPRLGGAEVAVVTTEPVERLRAWAPTAATLPGVSSVDPPTTLERGVSFLGLRTGDGGLGEDSRRLVDRLRAERPPFAAYVVGQASGVRDFATTIVERGPYALALVALATFVLLFLMTGSVVIPVKALAMNVVSLGACLGAVVWVFQEGHLSGALDFASTGAVESTIPLLVLAFGFGLSMDYEVFLLSRVVELHEQGHPTDTAVRLGLQRSGRIITSAALLMVIVFAGFATADLLVMKQMGFGLVVAVLVDATLVRMLLVPATMTVLGQANWWAPRALRRLHERWGITE